jgi:hypothetical protein
MMAAYSSPPGYTESCGSYQNITGNLHSIQNEANDDLHIPVVDANDDELSKLESSYFDVRNATTNLMIKFFSSTVEL